MKYLHLVVVAFTLSLYACSGEESSSKSDKDKSEKEHNEDETEDISELESKVIFESYPEAVGECPENSGFTSFNAVSGLLSKFEDHDIPGEAKYCQALFTESSMTPGNYKLFIYFTNKDTYSLDRISSGRIGDLDDEKDFVAVLAIESKGLPKTGTYTKNDESELQVKGFWLFGKGAEDDKFIRSGPGLDEISEITINSISEDKVCGEFKLVGFSEENNWSGTFNCNWTGE